MFLKKKRKEKQNNICVQARTRLVAIPAVEGVVVLVKAMKGVKT